jgi:hypothetical protein
MGIRNEPETQMPRYVGRNARTFLEVGLLKEHAQAREERKKNSVAREAPKSPGKYIVSTKTSY